MLCNLNKFMFCIKWILKKEMGGLRWINLAQDRCAPLNTVRNLQIPYHMGNSFTS